MAARVEALVDTLFEAFQRGDWDTAGRCFDATATVSQRFGPTSSGPGKSWHQVRKDLAGITKLMGLPKYGDRRKICSESGFVEQHITELTPPGAKKPVQLQAALVGRIDARSGLITSLEEYLDPTPLGLDPPAQKAKKSGLGTATSPKESRRLDGLVAVVSGASSGIGEGIALECARRGGKLVLTARRVDELQRVASACRHAGASEVVVVDGDTCKEDTVERVGKAAADLGGVDRLYVNAGISQNTPFMDAPVSLVREQMEVNFFGGVLLTRACLPSLLQRGGRIAAISSLQGRLPAPRNTGYSASKHAMHGFFESLRQEIGHKGVSVTMVLPGPVDTGILSNLQGPGGSTVALVLSEDTKKGITSASEAGRISVAAVEDGEREVAFPKAMAKLIQLRAGNQEKADAIVRQMYETMETREVGPTAKL